MRALPRVRRLPLPGPRLRRTGRDEGAVGRATRFSVWRASPSSPLEPILPAASQFGYRNKMEYSFTELEAGPTLGLHRAGRWDEVLDIEQCRLTTDLGNGIRNRMRDWAREEKLPAYNQETHEGYLRHLLIREGRNTGQALVQLVTARGERFDRERLIEVLTEFPEVRSIHWSVNEGVSEVTNLPTELLWGEDAIEEKIGGLRYRVRPNAFIQTNTEMAEQLYALAREFAGLTGGETVYDLYCGIGTIGLSMAAEALTVWGIEISEESVACAIENQELNAIGNTAFFAGNVGEVLARTARAGGSARRGRRRPAARRSRGEGAEAPRRARVRRASSTSRATRRRLPVTSSGSATTTATGSCAQSPSTCSRTRRTSSASRCWRGRDADLPVQGLRHAISARRRAARGVPDLRGPAPVHPARRGAAMGRVAGVHRGPQGRHSRRPRHSRHRLRAGLRDRPARAARQVGGRQRPLGLHALSRRRDRRPDRRRRRARGDRDLAPALLRLDGRMGAHVRLPDPSARSRAEMGDASRSCSALLGRRDEGPRRRADAHPLWRPLRGWRRCSTGPSGGRCCRATSCR